MKLSAVLFQQHIGRHFKKHWIIQGKKKILKSPAEELLAKKGIPVYKPEDIYQEKRKFEKIEIIGMKQMPLKFDNTHPDWHDRMLLTYKDNNVLLEGLKQAQILTKTLKVGEGLPEGYVLPPSSKELNKRVKNIILNSHIFDAEQQKLPKRRDPERPAWNFPRDYGVTFDRRNKLITSKLLHLLECNENHDIVKQRYVLNDLMFSFPFEKEETLIQFQVTGNVLLLSRKPLSPVLTEAIENLSLPDLHPIKCTVTLNEENVYKLENIYPIKKEFPASPHTVFVHYDSTDVKNEFEEEVTEDQIHGQSLLKTFTVAASYAKQQYGENVKGLPSPVTVQCVHTDGRLFHFGILQLNTLNLDDGDITNYWYQTDRFPLFEVCKYDCGIPILKGYNDNVLKHLICFYSRN